MFERFNDKKLDNHRMRYRGDNLFRVWAPTLCHLENQLAELNAEEIWSETETIRQNLIEIKEHRDTEVEFLLSKLSKKHQVWIEADGEKHITRDSQQGERTAIIILTVLFSQFADASPELEEDGIDRNPNKAVCNALAHIIMKPKFRSFASNLISSVERKRHDYDGNKIILPITDYMDIKSPRELMDEEAKSQIELMVSEIEKHTQGLKTHLNIKWEQYVEIWRDICSIPEIMPLLQKKCPNSSNNIWGKNLKLVANIIGIMKSIPQENKEIISGSIMTISDSLESNVRVYIRNHTNYGTNDTVLDVDLHNKIHKLIANRFS